MLKKPYTKSGLVLVNKPVGISSNHVVNIVKHALGAKKCGHLGTLDLEGEGLLPVTVNSATRLFDFFLKKDKTYETVFVFGFETDTLDTSGQIIKQKECHITKSQVQQAIKTMLGRQLQMPPQYSAKKVGGKVAYKEARKGGTIELQPKEIEIFEFKLLEELKENIFKFEISCSSGTYIRSVCRDLAEKLSTYGSMQCITRTRCSSMQLSDAYTLEEIKKGEFEVVPSESLFDYPCISLSKEDATRLLNGQKIFCKQSGLFKVFSDELFLGVGETVGEELKLKLRLI